jgi:hypothetical protein
MNIELLEQPSTELTVQDRAALALSSDKTRADLAALVLKSARIIEIKNRAGRDECHSATMALVKARTAISAKGKTARDDATKFSKAVISEEASLTEITTPEEKRLRAMTDAWDAKEAHAKEKLAEAVRVQAAIIQARIDSLDFDMELIGATAERIQRDMALLHSTEVSLEIFGARAGEAQQVKTETLENLGRLHATTLATELRQAAMAEQQAKIDAATAELAVIEKRNRDAAFALADKLATERQAFADQQASVTNQPGADEAPKAPVVMRSPPARRAAPAPTPAPVAVVRHAETKAPTAADIYTMCIESDMADQFAKWLCHAAGVSFPPVTEGATA